jgi:hypothetical protein
MKLRGDLALGEHFVLLGQSAWQKLLLYFGGAPEINFYLVDRQYLSIQEGDKLYNSEALEKALAGSTSKEGVPDLRPVTVRVC